MNGKESSSFSSPSFFRSKYRFLFYGMSDLFSPALHVCCAPLCFRSICWGNKIGEKFLICWRWVCCCWCGCALFTSQATCSYFFQGLFCSFYFLWDCNLYTHTQQFFRCFCMCFFSGFSLICYLFESIRGLFCFGFFNLEAIRCMLSFLCVCAVDCRSYAMCFMLCCFFSLFSAVCTHNCFLGIKIYVYICKISHIHLSYVYTKRSQIIPPCITCNTYIHLMAATYAPK